MITVEKHSIILCPTENEFENESVTNSGVYQDGDTLHFLYRAIQKSTISTIGYAKTNDPLKIVERMDHPLISIEFDYESCGMEDPKIVKIEDTFYITYIVYDGMNKAGALATSKDLITFEKQGIITPKIKYHDYESLINFSSKNLNPKYHTFYKLFKEIGLGNDSLRFLRIRALSLFPRKINEKFALLISIYPGIQIVYFDKFSDLTNEFWIDFIENISDHIVLDPYGVYEVNYVGVGCVPIETNEGWLVIYFGAQETTTGIRNHIKAALLDIDNPKRILSRLKTPLFSPHKLLHEKTQMSDMVYPTGHALFGDDLYIYYGVANKFIAVASLNINELLLELRNQE
jgi:predicted GH43/DUF377 family glycosyl hydrolase